MRISDFPDWALRFRKKGFTVRRNGNGFALFRVSSHRVRGLRYPKTEQEFVGMIDREKGLIPKKIRPGEAEYLEFGLSSVIYRNFFRTLARSLFNAGKNAPGLVKLGIVCFMFGGVGERLLGLTSLSYGDPDLLALSRTASPERIKRLSQRISRILEEKVGDADDRSYLIQSLRLVVVPKGCRGAGSGVSYPAGAAEIMDRYGIRYE